MGELVSNNLKDKLENKIRAITEGFKQELSVIRSNRPTPKMVENIKVDYLGQKLSIKQLASIGILPPSTIELNVWDSSVISAISKVIESANLGVSVVTEGKSIRVNLPLLSEERRKELIKTVKKEAEKTRIYLRTIRDEFNKKINSQFENKEISEDQKFKLKEKVQKAIDDANKEIESLNENKIKEISI
ncbi:ribosome recycling factor [Candidatus Wolfebacteria bacterium CG03_land_8_20_14_0_80_36_15]|uniref:Ribosome recycling factor n=1 Tax=Candidatus Wolfebacteria bacterium CG03_land_8_20_14_0_80_36_15 TaxID=1975067 RepID=A0A2M7B7H6_9BACT|nr:MAG: ribosome recycling factor [Candidatus Wolfebacteria bacterium CG03_land_8_20_14_0_80_36_15]